MGMLMSAIAALSTFYPEAKDIQDPDNRYRQINRLISKGPTIAAMAYRASIGMSFVYPDNNLNYAENFLSMMWKVAEPTYEPDPVLARALDVLLILHADHEQNCSTTTMRVVGSSHADVKTRSSSRFGGGAALTPAISCGYWKAKKMPVSACSTSCANRSAPARAWR